MEPRIAALVLLSAFLHPLWNALIKDDPRPEGAFLSLMASFLVFASLHALAFGEDLLSVVDAWPFVLVSSLGLAIYGYFLVLTYKSGDLSIYYPIVRSTPLFIVAVGVLFLGQSYTASLLGGIALVMVGAVMLQYRPGTRLFSSPVTLRRALIALAGTGIYSISDSRGVRIVEPMVLMFWIQVLVYPTLIVAFARMGNHGFGELMFAGWRRTPLRYAVTGVICYSSYYLILSAYQMGGDVAAVTSIRQASIPVSVLIGGLWLKEEAMTRRLFASGLLALGIVVIVISPRMGW